MKFNIDDRVEFMSTGSSELDGKIGTVLGLYAHFAESGFLIVLLDEPLPDRKAVVITENCLTLLGE
jgi:hypothetical protein